MNKSIITWDEEEEPALWKGYLLIGGSRQFICSAPKVFRRVDMIFKNSLQKEKDIKDFEQLCRERGDDEYNYYFGNLDGYEEVEKELKEYL